MTYDTPSTSAETESKLNEMALATATAQDEDNAVEIVTVIKTCAYDPMIRL